MFAMRTWETRNQPSAASVRLRAAHIGNDGVTAVSGDKVLDLARRGSAQVATADEVGSNVVLGGVGAGSAIAMAVGAV